MALDEGSRTQKILGDYFLFTEILRVTFLQITVEFGEINVRNTTFENATEVDTKLRKILVEYNVYPVLAYPNRYFTENSRWVPLIKWMQKRFNILTSLRRKTLMFNS